MKTLSFLTLIVIAVVLTRTNGTKQSSPVFNQCIFKPCKNGGQCIGTMFSPKCKCRPGYAGSQCQIRDPCHRRPCKNGGMCMRLRNGFQCKCRTGYAGQYCQTYCKRAVADIVFVLDESGSIGYRNFETIKAFVKKVISVFPISKTQVRIGVITFSTNIRNEFNLNRYFTHRNLHYAINRIRYNGGATNTHLALNYLKRHSFQVSAGGRRLIPQIAIVITDGRSTHPQQTRHFAKILKGSGIQVYAIGIGNKVPRSELVTIASHPSNEHIYGLHSFAGLSNIQSSLARKACLASEPCMKNPCRNGAKCVNLWKDFKCICKPGFQGKRCETELNPCRNRPCKNGGVCTSKGQKFTCKCRPGYTGTYCHTYNPCHNRPCKNGGACIAKGKIFTCKCSPGYSGRYCQAFNPCHRRPCKNGGVCIAKGHKYTCKCRPGYSGAHCHAFNPCHRRPCKNGGVCIAKGHRYTCKCRPGYSGAHCHAFNPCHKRPCKNGGVCIAKGQIYTCKCRPGFNGAHCHAYNPCHNRPCKNGGACIAKGRIFTCKCSPGYSGRHCEAFNPCHKRPCKNGGVCIGKGQRYTCKCRPGYSGAHCHAYNPCHNRPCKTGGACIAKGKSFTCKCSPGYSGQYCEAFNPCHKRPCKNGGVCIGKGQIYTCKCRPGFSGAHCHAFNPCHSRPCKNRGVCIAKGRRMYCKCPPGYRGRYCQAFNPCHNRPCKNHGLCIGKGRSFTCKCRPGYSGRFCTSFNPCHKRPCKNGGVCMRKGNGFHCKCRPGYSGRYCHSLNPCHKRPCKNGGVCMKKGNGFHCKCRPGYSGRYCLTLNPCHKRPCKNGGACIRKGQSFTCKCRPGYAGKYCRTPCKAAVADIVFVLDESGSITRPNFKIIKTFVKNLISVVPISKTQVRVGVITFSTHMKNEFNLNRYFTRRQLYHAIDRIQYSSGRTNTHLALNYLKRHAFQSAAGGRRLIPQIAIVVTDGKSSKPEQTQRTARILKESGIHIYAIGIGDKVPRSELVTIASRPSKEYIYGINSFRDLSKIQADLASKTCIASEPCRKNPCQNGGKCVNLWKDFKCICESGFRGNRCEIVDPCSSAPCKNNGTCINEGYEFRCQCRSGFRGDICSIVDPCSSSPCKNNGICKNNGYEFSCQCRDGFRGDVCHIGPPCSSSPCQNGGKCTNGNDDFTCQCLPVYRGKDCSIVDPCHTRPCKNNGSCTNNGTSYSCECTPYFLGESCEKAKPECSCITFGKAFYRTFDDQMLQFNGSCSETLVKSLPGPNSTDFIVKIIKTKKFSSSEPTLTRIVETKLKNTTIQLLPFNTIQVNSEERSLPVITKDFTVRLSVGWISLTTDWGLTVKYDGVHQAHITLPISFAEKVEGNCGDCNGKKDDLPSAPNRVISLYREGLQVQSKTSCKVEALTVPCSRPMQCDTIFQKPEFQKCVQTIGEENVGKLLKSCRSGLCSAQNKEDAANKLCEILEAFASECEKASISVKWRSPTFCPKLCPSNQVYESKVLRCQPSCINKTPNCTKYTEGCVCKPGFLLSGEECVPESECGCFTNGIYMKLHEEIYSVDCLTKSICRKGGKVEITKTGPCQANSDCKVSHGKRSCVCNEGYSLYKGNCDNLGFGKFIRVQHALLHISPIYTFRAEHPNNCAKKCQQIKRCLAFNYDNKNDICSLLPEDASINNTLKSLNCEHTDYYQLKKVSGSKNVINGAALGTCDEKKSANDINSIQECEKTCLNVKCSAFDYSATKNQCHLFERVIKHHGLYGDEDIIYVGFPE